MAPHLSSPTSLTIWRDIRRIEDPIDLARHDKIILVQPLDLLGAQRDGRVPQPKLTSGWCPSVSAKSPTSRTKSSAARKLLKWNVRSMRWPSSRNSQFGVCDRKCSASASVSRGTPPRQGVHFFWASVSVMSGPSDDSLGAKANSASCPRCRTAAQALIDELGQSCVLLADRSGELSSRRSLFG